MLLQSDTTYKTREGRANSSMQLMNMFTADEEAMEGGKPSNALGIVCLILAVVTGPIGILVSVYGLARGIRKNNENLIVYSVVGILLGIFVSFVVGVAIHTLSGPNTEITNQQFAQETGTQPDLLYSQSGNRYILQAPEMLSLTRAGDGFYRYSDTSASDDRTINLYVLFVREFDSQTRESDIESLIDTAVTQEPEDIIASSVDILGDFGEDISTENVNLTKAFEPVDFQASETFYGIYETVIQYEDNDLNRTASARLIVYYDRFGSYVVIANGPEERVTAKQSELDTTFGSFQPLFQID